MRILTLLTLVCAISSPAFAQAPATPPLILHIPATARTAALGDAWVAGRDQEVIFYNPAQMIGARAEFGLTFTRPGATGNALSMGQTYTGGKWSLTLGWGARFIDFNVDPAAGYPYTADTLLSRGAANGQSALVAFGGAILWRNMRIGGVAKYVSDRVATAPGAPVPLSINQRAWVADVGIARNVIGGVAAFSVQNLGPTTATDPAQLITPRQFLAGYSMTRAAGPLDLGMYSQVTMRKGWWSPAGGFEAGYSWIEGYNIALRVGARRPETATERPLSLGAAFTADRLVVEYGVRFFDGGQAAHSVTVRWR